MQRPLYAMVGADTRRQSLQCGWMNPALRDAKAIHPPATPVRRCNSAPGFAAAWLAAGLWTVSGSPAGAQTVSLGAAQNMAVLGGTTVTNTGVTAVIGNLGVSPGTSITGFPPGTVQAGAMHFNDLLASQAQADAATTYTTLAGEAATTNLSGTNLGGLTLTPGVYRFDTAAQLTGTLNLDTTTDPNGTYVFQIGTTLTTASDSAVRLLGRNGADPNIFWQVGSSATLGTASVFDGNILAFTSITLNTAANLAVGRALAINGPVTLDTNQVNSTGALVTGSFWNGGAGNLWSGVNWSPDASGATSSTLVSGADVVFSVTGVAPQNETTLLDANETISSLTVNDPAAVTISGLHTLSIAGTGVTRGININSGAGLTTINSALDLSGLSQGITVNNTAGLVINGSVGGTIGLTKAGSGQLTLTTANTYTGGTTVLGGVLSVANDVNLGDATGGLTLAGGELLTTGVNFTSARLVTLSPSGNANTLAAATGTTAAYSGGFSGAGGLTVGDGINTGTVALTGGANTYLGGTTVTGGATLSVDSDAELGDVSGGLTLSRGKLVIVGNGSGYFSTARTLTLGSGTDILAPPDIAFYRTATFTGLVTGPGGLTVGDSTLQYLSYSPNLTVVLTNSLNNYAGGTTVTGGATLSVDADAELGSAGTGITLAGGTLSTSADGFSSPRAIVLSAATGANTLGADFNTTATYTGPVAGAGGLAINGGGTVVLANAGNSYFGGTTVRNATVSVAADGALGNVSGGITLAAGELLTTTDGFSTGRPVQLAAGEGVDTLAAAPGTTGTYTGVVSGDGGGQGLFVGDSKGNTGTVVLTNLADSYTNGTTVQGSAVLSAATDAVLGDPSSGITLRNGELLTTADGFLTQRPILLRRGTDILAAVAATTATYQGVISGSNGLQVGDGNFSDRGTVVLTNVSNSYTGGTTVFGGGTLSVDTNAELGDPSGGIILKDGGELLTTADLTSPRLVSLNPSGNAGPGIITPSTASFPNTLAAAPDTTATYMGVIFGTGGLQVGDGTNAGTVVLAGTNTYTGGTTILPGTLIAENNTALGADPAVIKGGTLEVPAGVTLANAVSFGPGGGSLLNAGTLNNNVLDASNGCTCPQWVENDTGGVINGNVLLGTGPNTVQLYSGSTIAGNLDLGPNAGSTLILNGAGDQLWSAAVAGTEANPGSLVKLGSGTWTLDQPAVAAVGTDVQAGGLVVDATLTSAQVTVDSGATLSGTGTVTGNLTNNGLLQPGSATLPGTLQVTGNYVQGSSGSFSVRLASATVYDQLHVGGTAALGGNLTWGVLNGYAPPPGSLFTILTAPGGVSGSYASVTHPQGVRLTLQINADTVTLSSPLQTGGGTGSGTAGGAGTLFTVPTNPDNSTRPTAPVVLTLGPGGLVTETFYPFRLFATNANQFGVARALDSARFSSGALSDFTAVIAAASLLQANRLTQAFDQLSPEAVPAFSTIAFTLESAQSAQLGQRFEAIREGNAYEFNNQPMAMPADAGKSVTAYDDGKGGGKEVYAPPKLVEVAHGDRWGAFVTGSGTFAGVDRATDLLGYNFNTGGVTAGLDYRLTRTWAVGLYGGYAHTQADFEQNNRLYVDGGKWGLYSTWSRGGFYLNGTVGGGYNSYDLRRDIDFVNRTARSHPDAWEFDALGGGGYDWHLGPLTAGLNAALQYTHLDVQGFTETGAGSLDLQVSPNHADSLRQYLGGHLYYAWRVSPRLTITPEADLAWQHEYLDGGRAIDAAFQGGAGPGFTIHTSRAGSDSAFGGAGVTATYKNVSAYFFYNPEFGSGDLISHTISGGVRVAF